MVVKKTAYRREFSPPRSRTAWQEYEEDYNTNVDYRFERRQEEHQHRDEHFLWQEWDWATDSDSDEEDDTYRGGLPGYPLPKHVEKHRKLLQKYQQRAASRQDRLRNHQHELYDREVQTPEAWGPVEVRPAQEQVQEEQGQGEGDAIPLPEPPAKEHKKTAGKEKDVRPARPKKSRPVKPNKYRKIPAPRPMNEPLGRPSRRPLHDHPFLPYGMADQERETGALQTHNVRAGHNIYPAALKAERRHKAAIERREEEREKATYREKRKLALFNEKALFNERMVRETSRWSTEYRDCFAGYEKDTYERNLRTRSYAPSRVDKIYVPA
ncbi:centriole, cilia and spindle-associated protein [Lingula anatina]|uniref:Centriole, cilia and spindle-associated protein n=1 Tax=Lingula anatina TaxID=7574 RepID=A0A1S3I949_LINAN|nr:centriole, cilia and spindle-associated protein [Lingula anatina]|eukprot:XP_013394391.1 centriole, cilia and spindle-associated protein [Lingula anatina]